MKKALLALCAVLLLTNAVSTAAFFRARLHYRTVLQNAMEEKTRIQDENATLKKTTELQRESNEAFRKEVQLGANLQQIVGIYHFRNATYRSDSYLDLRSDGTAQYRRPYSDQYRPTSWACSNQILTVPNAGVFHLENGDLIDEKGNRWLHIR